MLFPFLAFLITGPNEPWIDGPLLDAVTEAILSKREADLKSKMCDQHGDSGKETSPVTDILAFEEPPLARDKMKAMIWVRTDKFIWDSLNM